MKLLKSPVFQLPTLHSQKPFFLFSKSKKEPDMENFNRIMDYNKSWAKAMVEEDPDYFKSLVGIQRPDYLWIGCADSRVPANQICGLKAG